MTVVEGTVTARRAALPAPLPLKFKDDVLLQDGIATGDKSLARLLLGGKAVVTVRERSLLTVTEVPGYSRLEIDSGKFVLVAAREKMRPGEEIQIRTPNAIAGVRGTVVVTEVVPPSGGRPMVTNFYVLRGTITAQPIDPSGGQPVGTPLQVREMEVYSLVGSSPSLVSAFTADRIAAITEGLSPSGEKAGSDAGQELVKEQAIQTALTLLANLTGSDEIRFAAMPSNAAFGFDPSLMNTLLTRLSSTDLSSGATSPTTLSPFSRRISGGLTLLPGERLATFSGLVDLTQELAAIVEVLNALVTQAGADGLLSVNSGALVSLASPLMTVTNSTLTTAGEVLDVAGALVATTTSALLSFDPSIVSARNLAVVGPGGSVALTGPLVSDIQGALTFSRSLLSVSGGGSLTSTSPLALSLLTNSSVVTGGDFYELGGVSSVTLGGPLLNATASTITANTSDASSSVVTAPPVRRASVGKVSDVGRAVFPNSGPLSIAITPDGSRAYAVDFAGFFVIDVATNTRTAGVDLGLRTVGIAISPDGTRAYIAATRFTGNTPPNGVAVVDTNPNSPTFNQLLAFIAMPASSATRNVAITPDGSRVYVTNQAGNVNVISTSTNTIVATISAGLGPFPFGIAISPDGTRAYITSQPGGQSLANPTALSVIDTNPTSPTFNQVIGIAQVGRKSFAAVVTPNGERVYVSNLADNTVSVISASTLAVVATIPVGVSPRGIAVSPDGSKVFVANRDSGSLSVISTASNTVIATVTSTVSSFPRTGHGSTLRTSSTSTWPCSISCPVVPSLPSGPAVV
jgi:YVTN family beta-propeller protein